MYKDLIFCLTATVPVFLMMVLGMFLKKIGIMSAQFTKTLNSFVFRVSLPILVFCDMRKMDFYQTWNTKYVMFCFLATLASILLVMGLSYVFCRRDLQGEFIQTSYRSSAALLGAALVKNIYGTIGMVPLMIIGAVPLYNIAAVAVLSFYQPHRAKMDKEVFRKTIRGIVTNPLIIAILVGLGWSLLRIPLPTILDRTLTSVGATATPMGLIALGASFSLSGSTGAAREVILSVFMKLVGLGLLFLPIAIALGFRNDELVATMIMCGSPTTVSCFVMAKELGHEGSLTASVVMLATLLCSFTLTVWLFVFRSMGLI